MILCYSYSLAGFQLKSQLEGETVVGFGVCHKQTVLKLLDRAFFSNLSTKEEG